MIDKLRYTQHIQDIELQQIAVKVIDQVNSVIDKHIIRTTDFLTPYHGKAIINILVGIKGINYIFNGGYDGAERRVITIFPDYMEAESINVPIAPIEVVGSAHFNKCTHRDYLGAILGLGIKREKLGDILVHDDGSNQQVCQIIIKEDLKDYILFNLDQVGNCRVNTKEITYNDILVPRLDYKEYSGNVSSLRLDAVLGSAYNLSRSVAQSIINKELVSVNWEIIKKSGYEIKCDDVISVRGKGRVYITEVGGRTRSDRIKLSFKKPL
ncbi:YlmH family RNA-binding protein [Alkaliphilus peptidifermentans]|uniref:RNA-binding protein YlmH, contains S4-like domain n=1 Tax=Alkaliphilus peptidifermentans DSM 18978 TaxID=1120976 RepID=A0A1G5BAC2_9FIRM|nr:YlmH/Sll1252 family protein [Alkaliphilus peptidifermentans]SCX87023.1 RNA-binding protein YlmH, contains S4-like domain [Alkaliphilus peptidifermentans DSM 18978]